MILYYLDNGNIIYLFNTLIHCIKLALKKRTFDNVGVIIKCVASLAWWIIIILHCTSLIFLFICVITSVQYSTTYLHSLLKILPFNLTLTRGLENNYN